MTSPLPPLCAAVLAMAMVLAGSPPPVMAQGVDLQLLLAVDVSPSVDADEYALQIHGLATALRNPEVVDAIRMAAPNGVAIALMQWAGPSEQAVSVQWSNVRDQASAEIVARQIEVLARPFTNGGTAIGDALARGIALLDEGGFQAGRRVIDISGDGSTNIGDSPAPVRTRAVLSGITVNGLVILDEEQHLASYYLRRVIGGPGAFVLDIRDFGDFAEAIKLKLIREIVVSMASPAARYEGVGVLAD